MELNQQGNENRTENVADQNEVDRLSFLPPEIIHHMLSLMETKDAIQTCVLSKRWTHHWTHMQSLFFNYMAFHRLPDFKQFVYEVLRRHQPANLFRIKFYGTNDEDVIEDILLYVKELKAEELEIKIYTVELDRVESSFLDEDMPATLLECQSLKTLKMDYYNIKVPKELFNAFGSLTTLELSSCNFYAQNRINDCISCCPSMKNLSLTNCHYYGKIFEISAENLVNLIVSNLLYHCDDADRKLVLSTPGLKFLDVKGIYPLLISVDTVLSLERVTIFMVSPIGAERTDDWKQMHIRDLMHMAGGFSHAKSLAITLYVEEVMNIFLRRETLYEEPKVEEEMIDESLSLEEPPWMSQLLSLIESD